MKVLGLQQKDREEGAPQLLSKISSATGEPTA